jgi:hypothetical protein
LQVATEISYHLKTATSTCRHFSPDQREKSVQQVLGWTVGLALKAKMPRKRPRTTRELKDSFLFGDGKSPFHNPHVYVVFGFQPSS